MGFLHNPQQAILVSDFSILAAEQGTGDHGIFLTVNPCIKAYFTAYYFSLL